MKSALRMQRRVLRQGSDVSWLEVAMNDALGVSGRQRRGNLAGDADGVGAHASPGDAPAQGLALQVLHDDVGAAVFQAAKLKDADQARMLDDIDRARFV